MVPIRGPDAGSGHEVGPRVTIRGPDAGSGPGFLRSGGRAPLCCSGLQAVLSWCPDPGSDPDLVMAHLRKAP